MFFLSFEGTIPKKCKREHVSAMNILEDKKFFLVRIKRWYEKDFEPVCNFKPKLDESGVYTGEEAIINDDVYKPIASVTMHQNAYTNETHYTFQCKRNSDSNLGIQWYECEDGKCPRIMEPSWMQGRGLIYLFMRDDGDL